MKLWFSRFLLGALALILLLIVGSLAYVRLLNSEVSSVALLRGHVMLWSKGAAFVEIAPSQYLVENRGEKFAYRSQALEAHLKKWGWTFDGTMGAGLIYKRGEERLSGVYTGCGSRTVIVLDNDPSDRSGSGGDGLKR